MNEFFWVEILLRLVAIFFKTLISVRENQISLFKTAAFTIWLNERNWFSYLDVTRITARIHFVIPVESGALIQNQWVSWSEEENRKLKKKIMSKSIAILLHHGQVLYHSLSVLVEMYHNMLLVLHFGGNDFTCALKK